jgi:subtilisin
MDSIKRKDIKHITVSLFIFFAVAFAFEGHAQQPPERPGRPQTLQEKLYGHYGSRQRLLAEQQKVQASKPIAPATGRDKCTPRCDELLAKARQQGLMSIMVTLDVPDLPDETRVPKEKQPAVMRERETAISQVQDRVLQRMHSHKIKSVRKFKLTPGLGLTVDAAALQTLITDPEVIQIHESQIFRLMLNQSGPLIGATQAWANGFSGAGYTVAILDSGVDSSHPFLAGKVVLEACYSGAPPGSTPLCPGGQTAVVGPGAAAPCSFPGCDHGTHVAGIAAGNGPNFSGIAKDARIIAAQVFSYDPLFDAITSSESDIQSALDYVRAIAAANKVVAVNMSFGGRCVYRCLR